MAAEVKFGEWQPIETAQREVGKTILIAKGDWVSVARWTDRFAAAYGDTSAGWYSPELDRRIEPEKWMPLPGAPFHG